MSDPQRLPSPPSRTPPKRLGKLPVGVAVGACVLLVLLPLGAVMVAVVRQHNANGSEVVDAAPGSPGDAISDGTGFAQASGPPIIEAVTRVPSPAREEQRASAPAQPPPQRQPDVHEMARLQAWQAYYQQLAQLRDDRHKAAFEAMRADPNAMAVQAQGGQQGGGGGQPGAPRALPPMPRPGELYQGPVGADGLYLATAPVPAMSPYELKRAVSIIPFRLHQNIATGAAGQFVAVVTKHVTAYGTDDILIPQGAYLVGVYDDQTGANDERMRTAVQVIVYPKTGNPSCPGGEELPLGSMPAADSSGQAGFSDQVHRHYGRRIFNAVIQAVGGAATQVAMPRGGGFDPASVLAMQMGQAGQNVISQSMPREQGATFETRAGYPGILQLTRSIAFAGPWKPGLGFCGTDAGAVLQ